MMEAKDLKQLYLDNLRSNSGLEQHRPYLGMSGISQCPRSLYNQILNGRNHQTDRDHWYCREGYKEQAEVLALLGAVNPRETEVIADFDPRFRGHTDWEIDGALVEVKSVGWDKFKQIVLERKATNAHYEQVICYLAHGGWPRAFLVYKARDIPPEGWAGDIVELCGGIPVWVFAIYPNGYVAQKLNQKARQILKAVDSKEPPRCSCGRCR